jgi:hypothetical protein
MADNVRIKGNETTDNNQFDQPYYRTNKIVNIDIPQQFSVATVQFTEFYK